MIDRSRALVAAVIAVVVAVVLISIGFVAGQASGDDEGETPATPPRSGDGLPSGPTGIEDGIPVGFARSEEGVLGAAVAWVPWLMSGPSGERPRGLDDVVLDSAGEPVPDEVTLRFTFAPIAGKVEMESDTRAVVTLLGPVLEGNLGEELTGEFWSFPTTFAWDDDVDDWRIAELPAGASGNFVVDGPLDAADVEGFQSLRPAGVAGGPPIIEAVPGE